jgi:hypothetical protein
LASRDLRSGPSFIGTNAVHCIMRSGFWHGSA